MRPTRDKGSDGPAPILTVRDRKAAATAGRATDLRAMPGVRAVRAVAAVPDTPTESIVRLRSSCQPFPPERRFTRTTNAAASAKPNAVTTGRQNTGPKTAVALKMMNANTV